MRQHGDEDLYALLAAAGAQAQRLARKVGEAPKPRRVVEAHLRRLGPAPQTLPEQRTEPAVGIGPAPSGQRLVPVPDPELAPRQPGAPPLARCCERFDDRIPVGLQWSSMSDASAHFNITGGRIVDGQFTATLTGMGAEDAESDDTVLGYKGGILGEFYGPAAEEVGGVLSASSDTHNRVLYGYFSGEQLNSTSSDELPAQSMALVVDRPESTVSIIGTAGVTGVQCDGAGGFHVTYTIGDDEQTVHLEASDLGSYAGTPFSYHERVENRSYFLWDATNSFYNDPEFDHFNVNGWAMTDWADEGYDFDASTSRSGYVAHGTRAETDDLPTGTASYSGRAWVQILPADNPASSARSRLRGSLALNADFGADTVGGSISWNEKRDPGQSSYQTTTGSGQSVTARSRTNGSPRT